MKKVLIASTALVAASLVGTAAQASEKIKLELGGFSKWWVVGATQSKSYKDAFRTGNTRINPAEVDIKGDNEIFFSGSTTLDNGLKVGINIELEAGGASDTRQNAAAGTTDVIDKSAVFIEGGFGKVIVGTEANGTVLLHVMAPDAAGNWGGDGILTGGFAVIQPTGWSAGGTPALPRVTTEIDTDDNAEKITYVSPTFYGLTVGGSYIPNALSEDTRGVETNATAAYGVGALYANTFGAVDVKVSGGFVWYDAQAAVGNYGGINTEWSAGTQISYAGFTVGGSYRGISDVAEAVGANPASSTGHVWDAGIQYATGPYAVSFAYLNSTGEGRINVAKDLKEEVYQVSGKYSMGPGVDALASAGRVKYTGETATANENNKGWAVMTGLSLAF